MFNKSIVLTVIGVIFLIFVSSLIFVKNSYNRFSFFERNIVVTWRELDEQLQKGYFLTAKLISSSSPCFKGEETLLSSMETALAKTDGISVSQYGELVRAQSNFRRSMEAAIAILRRCHVIENNRALSQTLDELNDIEIKIIASKKAYNKAISEYNASISKFPANIVATIMKLQDKPYFGNATQALP